MIHSLQTFSFHSHAPYIFTSICELQELALNHFFQLILLETIGHCLCLCFSFPVAAVSISSAEAPSVICSFLSKSSMPVQSLLHQCGSLPTEAISYHPEGSRLCSGVQDYDDFIPFGAQLLFPKTLCFVFQSHNI